MTTTLTIQQIAATKSLERAFKKCAKAGLQLYATTYGEDVTVKAVDRDTMRAAATTEQAEIDALQFGHVPLVNVEHGEVIEALVLFEDTV